MNPHHVFECVCNGVQDGYAMVSSLRFDKAPFAHGVRMQGIDPIGTSQSKGLPLVGNELVQLGMCMGVYDAGVVSKLPYGATVPLVEGTEDWCAAAPLRMYPV